VVKTLFYSSLYTTSGVAGKASFFFMKSTALHLILSILEKHINVAQSNYIVVGLINSYEVSSVTVTH